MSVCTTCGAPDSGDAIYCKFCKQPFNAAVVNSAVQCPKCRTPNRPERSHCVACQAPLAVTCLFCNHASAANSASCTHCGEAFEGAQARKESRDRAEIAKSVIGGVSSVFSAFTGHKIDVPGVTSTTPHAAPAQPQHARPPHDASDPIYDNRNAPRMPRF